MRITPLALWVACGAGSRAHDRFCRWELPPPSGVHLGFRLVRGDRHREMWWPSHAELRWAQVRATMVGMGRDVAAHFQADMKGAVERMRLEGYHPNGVHSHAGPIRCGGHREAVVGFPDSPVRV